MIWIFIKLGIKLKDKRSGRADLNPDDIDIVWGANEHDFYNT